MTLNGENDGAVAPRPALVAAYRQGLALASVVVIADAATVRVAARRPGEAAAGAGETVLQCFWCRRAAHAEAIVGAARSARRGAKDPADALARVCASVVAAAKRLAVPLHSDAEIVAEAMSAAARLDDEMQRQMRAGELKAINRAYRDYRLAARANGEKCSPYAQWIERYKANLMREIAANLRQL